MTLSPALLSASSSSLVMPLLPTLAPTAPLAWRWQGDGAAVVAVQSRGGATVAVRSKKQKQSPAGLASLLDKYWYPHVNPLVRFAVGGNLGNVALFVCERLVSGWLVTHSALVQRLLSEGFATQYADSISFFLGYMLHVPVQHWLYAALVYGLDSIDTPRKYGQTLAGLYAALTTSAIGSTLLNAWILQTFPSLHKTVAFVATMASFACFNYFFIGWMVRRSNEQAALSAKKKKGR